MHLPDIDNPRSRLPWVVCTALLLWGALIWVFGTLLGRMSPEPPALKPIDAQVVELRPSPIKTVPPKPLQPEPVRHAKPQATASHPTAPVPGSARSSEKPPERTSAPSTPVSLPGTNLPGNKAGSDTVPIYSESIGKPSPDASRGSITPPQFGAAYLNSPKPVYPPVAKRMGMEGMVMLKVLVSQDGGARKIEVAKSSGYEILDRAALEAVKNWRFVPARQGDSPIDEWVQVPVAFRLSK